MTTAHLAGFATSHFAGYVPDLGILYGGIGPGGYTVPNVSGPTRIDMVGNWIVDVDARVQIGLFLQQKYRRIAAEAGTYHAAKLLRKQGYPLEIARAVLL